MTVLKLCRAVQIGALGVASTLTVAAATPPSSSAGPGPAQGEAVPKFEAADQDDSKRDFGSLTGDQGLLLVFFRSADW